LTIFYEAVPGCQASAAALGFRRYECESKVLASTAYFLIKITKDGTAIVFTAKKVDSGVSGLSRSRESFFSCGLGIIILLNHKYI
jgi:hypothetical protein